LEIKLEFQGHKITELVSPEEIKNRIDTLGKEISKNFEGEIPIFIGVLNGSFIFMADLVRALTIDCEMDFIKVSSYSGTKSTGSVHLLKDLSADTAGRHVILVEDIVDSGITIKFIRDRFLVSAPASLSVVSLLLKPEIADIDFEIDYVGFEIPPEFVVGYGLDNDQKIRHLKGIYRLEQ